MTSCSILNDQSDWRVDAAWFWSQAGHINELESRSLVALFRALVQEGGDSCFSALLPKVRMPKDDQVPKPFDLHCSEPTSSLGTFIQLWVLPRHG